MSELIAGIDDRVLTAGFADPIFDSQCVFRSVLNAMSRPGQPSSTLTLNHPPAPLFSATAALCLTLLDADTPVWLGSSARVPAVVAFLRFHCACPLVEESGSAAFALLTDFSELPALGAFAQGEDRYPDRSTTVIAQVRSFDEGTTAFLQGPGIETEQPLQVADLPDDFWPRWRENHEQYPLGVDFMFTSPDQIVGLPRSICGRIK